MANRWHDAQVLITGGTSGIGAAPARAFVEAGAHVGITGRDADRLDAARSTTGAEWVYAGDLSRREDRLALVVAVGNRGSGLDLLVNNAGFMSEPDTFFYVFTGGVEVRGETSREGESGLAIAEPDLVLTAVDASLVVAFSIDPSAGITRMGTVGDHRSRKLAFERGEGTPAGRLVA